MSVCCADVIVSAVRMVLVKPKCASVLQMLKNACSTLGSSLCQALWTTSFVKFDCHCSSSSFILVFFLLLLCFQVNLFVLTPKVSQLFLMHAGYSLRAFPLSPLHPMQRGVLLHHSPCLICDSQQKLREDRVEFYAELLLESALTRAGHDL